MAAEDHPLEPDEEEMRALGEAVLDRVVDHVEGLDEAPAADVDDVRERVQAFREPLPEEGAEPGEVLDRLMEEAVPASLNTPHPGYLAYVPGGGLYESALADLLASATNRYVGTPFAAPVLAAVEGTVVDWCRDVVGLPADGDGILTSGGSLANLSATIAAREDRLPDAFLDGRVYVSDQAHHSVTKGARLAGFPRENVRVLPTDDAYRLEAGTVAEAVREDRGDGWDPFLVVASGGTTNTGAVDDLPGLAGVCEAEDLWFHVDAAYGGFFALTDRGREALEGIGEADSVTLDPHKALFVPYGVGCLVVRDGEALRRAHGGEAAYLEADAPAGVPDFSARSPELTRPLRGLAVWLPIKLHGIGPFREALDEKLDLARYAAEALAKTDGIDVVAEPQLSTAAFRVSPDVAGGEADRWTRALLEGVNDRGNVHVSGTTLEAGYAARVCVVSFRTHREHVEACVRDVREVLADLEEAGGPEA